MTVLELHGASAEVEGASVLRDVSISISTTSPVAIVGAAGSGKSTLARCLVGDAPLTRGRRILRDDLGSMDCTRFGPRELARHGVVLVPGTGAVFETLTVEENLAAAVVPIGIRGMNVEGHVRDAYLRFPSLRSRALQVAGLLSGGEQRLLAVARGLLALTAGGSPAESRGKLLILDEPTVGLHPSSVRQLMSVLMQTSSAQLGILILDEDPTLALAMAEVLHVLRSGSIVASGSVADLAGRGDLPELMNGTN